MTLKIVNFFLPIKFPSLNDYTAANRNNRYGGGAMKKKYTDAVAKAINSISITGGEPDVRRFSSPVDIELLWTEENKRRDPDNFIFAKKFILDGMVKAKLIPNDTQEWIKSIKDSWSIDKYNVGVTVNVRISE